MSTCPDFDLCIEIVTDPNDSNTILIRESEYPETVVRTSRKNWLAFLDRVKAGDFGNV
jgi:hypothetical protein